MIRKGQITVAHTSIMTSSQSYFQLKGYTAVMLMTMAGMEDTGVMYKTKG